MFVQSIIYTSKYLPKNTKDSARDSHTFESRFCLKFQEMFSHVQYKRESHVRTA